MYKTYRVMFYGSSSSAMDILAEKRAFAVNEFARLHNVPEWREASKTGYYKAKIVK